MFATKMFTFLLITINFVRSNKIVFGKCNPEQMFCRTKYGLYKLECSKSVVIKFKD